jgi:hypothetical protein
MWRYGKSALHDACIAAHALISVVAPIESALIGHRDLRADLKAARVQAPARNNFNVDLLAAEQEESNLFARIERFAMQEAQAVARDIRHVHALPIRFAFQLRQLLLMLHRRAVSLATAIHSRKSTPVVGKRRNAVLLEILAQLRR